MFRTATKCLVPALLAALAVVAACESHPDVTFADDDDDDVASPPVIAGAPTNVTAVAGTGSIALTWDEPTFGDTPTSYRVLVATTSCETWSASLLGAFDTTAGCCAFTGPFADDVSYWLAVSAVNAAGEGPSSTVVTARPPGWTGLRRIQPADGKTLVNALAVSGSFILSGGGFFGQNLDGQATNGIYDLFVSRLDRTGARIWSRSFGGTNIDHVRAIAIQADGAAAVVVGELASGSGPTDYVVRQYFFDGSSGFNLTLGTGVGVESDAAYGVQLDASNNVYVAGRTGGDLDGETAVGGSAAFLVKFNAAGVRTFTRLVTTASGEEAHGVALASDGTPYFVGATFGGVLPSGSLPANTNPGSSTDAFVSKFSTAGVHQWTKQLHTAGTETSRGVAVDSDGNVFVVGSSDGYFQTPAQAPGNTRGFVGRFASNGAQTWLVQFGGAGSTNASGVAVSGSGDVVYVVGDSTSSFGSGPTDGFLAAFDATSGLQEWVVPIGGAGGQYASSVAVDADGMVYVSGSLDTDLTNPIGFVAKFSPEGVLQ